MSNLAGLSLVSGIAVVQALANLGFKGVQLKWPNDVQVQGRKLAGILVELGGDALGPCHAVIGIGLNVTMDAEMARAIDQPWIDLDGMGLDRRPNRNLLASTLIAELIAMLDEFAQSDFPAFIERFVHSDALLGKQVRTSNGIEGEARGVDVRGGLRLLTGTGEIIVESGEVRVRDIAGSP